MKSFYKKVFLLFCLFAVNQAIGQDQILISSEGTIEACGGAFLDSGAQSGGYQSGENYTITICPETEGDVVWVEFLSTDIICPNPDNDCDYLEVFDGDSNGANSMGTVTGPMTFTASPLNTSGCLTFQFVSNGSGEGAGWSATVSCETPCERPLAYAETDPGGEMPIKVCMGEEITFDGTTSTVADGQEIVEWLWDFRDGTTDDSGPIVTHSYDMPGEYVVQLYLVDDNDCASTNRTDIQIWVSTEPEFIFEYPLGTSTCLGDTLELIMDELFAPVTWDAQPSVDLGSGITVPDIVGECFESTVELNSFAPGQTLDDIDDLEDIYINFEHSFMGDLLIQIICPDGTTVNLHEQGGGGTNLGEANQADDMVPGVGWDYWWAPDAALGTWEEESGTNTMPSGTGTSLISDTYSSVGDLEDLVGCPLNGVWSLSICDLWGADDGTVFEWAINFNPDLYPELTSFTPSYGSIDNDADSSYWEGSWIIENDPGMDELVLLIEEPGFHEYTAHLINDFGCEFDSTIVMEIYEALEANAGEDFAFCGGDPFLDGTLTGPENGCCQSVAGDYDYCWVNWDFTSFEYCPDDDDCPMTLTFTGGNLGPFDYVYVYDGGLWTNQIATIQGEELAGMSFTATNPTGCISFYISSDQFDSCDDGAYDALEWNISCGDQYVYTWTPDNILSDPNIPNPEIIGITEGTNFTLEVYPEGHPICATTDEVFVDVVEIGYAGIDSEMTICPSDDPVLMYDSMDGDPDTGGVWVDADDNEIGDFFDPTILGDGIYTYVVGPPGCSDEAELNVDVNDLDIQTSNDTIICIGGSADLSIQLLNIPLGDVSYSWNGGDFDTQDITVQPIGQSTYTGIVAYGDGCLSQPSSTTVSYYDPLSLELIDDDTICLGESFEIMTDAYGGGYNGYNFAWEGGDGTLMNGDQNWVTPDFTTEYCLTLTDGCETPAEQACMTVFIEDIVSPAFTGDEPEGCYPIAVNFDGLATNLENVSGVQWDFGDGETDDNIDQTSHNYPISGLYDVSYTIYTHSGCVYTDTLFDYVHAYPRPLASFGAEPGLNTLPDTRFTFNNYSVGNLWNYWYFDEYGTSEEEEPEFEFPDNQIGTYAVSLFVENEFGCVDSVTRYVSVQNEIAVYIPNTFTPNDDGVNDILFVQGIDINELEYDFIIYSRWGEVVFHTNDLYDFWNGSFNGSEYYVPDGVYPYRLETRSLTTGDKKVYVGSINVLR